MNSYSNPLLKYADFRYLYTSKLIGILCDRFFVITISWWLLHGGIENSNSLIGLIMGSSVLARIFSSPLMGVLADRYAKNHCMMAALALPMILLVIFIGSLSIIGQYPQLIIGFYFLMALFTPLLMSASTSGLSQVVPPHEMSKAVALDGNIMFIGQAIGSTLAGSFVMAAGIAGALSAEVAFYVAAILLAWRIKASYTANKQAQEVTNNIKTRPNVKQAMKEGLQYFRNDTFLMCLVTLFCLANFFMTPLMMAIPIITATVLYGTALDMSMLECSFAGGAIFVSLILGAMKIKLPLKNVLTLAFVMSGVLLLGISQTANFYIMILCLFIIGSCIGLINAASMAKMQAVVPEELKGRVFSLIMMIAMCITPIALVLTGGLSDFYGIMTIIEINGWCMVLLGVVTCWILYRKFNEQLQ